MDWDDFFEKTRVAAGVESFSKLAPKLGVTDGAIGHYRRGRQIPSVWVVADALRIQKHPNPEIAAVEIMRNEARTSSERTFWKRLAATAMTLVLGVGLASPGDAHAAMRAGFEHTDYTLCEMTYLARLHRRLRRMTLYFVGSGWRWLGLWLGSCFPARSPSTDEIAA